MAFSAWLVWSLQPHGVAPEAVEGSADVTIRQEGPYLLFTPSSRVARAGLVFLPGGLVSPKAYAPLAYDIARAGHPVALVSLPLRSAPTAELESKVWADAEAARLLVSAHGPWILAGHSRGAAIATRLLASSSSGFDAVVLIATTHPRVDLSELEIPVVKIGGTRDCVAPRSAAEANAGNLPNATRWVWIEGANHAQFGWYGRQLGDCGASITRRSQHDQLVASLLGLIADLEADHSQAAPAGGKHPG